MTTQDPNRLGDEFPENARGIYADNGQLIGVDYTNLTLEEQGLMEDMMANPTNYTLDELAAVGLNPDGTSSVQSQGGGGGFGDGLWDVIRGAWNSFSGFVGNDTIDILKNYLDNKKNKDAILEYNRVAQGITDAYNKLKKDWVTSTRGADQTTPRGEYVESMGRVVPVDGGLFGIDIDSDGTVDADFGSFSTREAAEAALAEAGVRSKFTTLSGDSVYTRDADDLMIGNMNSIRRVFQQLKTPEERKAFVDSVTKFADLQADRTSEFIVSAMSDEDMEVDGTKVKSIAKARTALINSLNGILGDTAAAINMADAIGTGQINKADFRRAVDVGDALNDQAEAVSDQEYFRAMAVVAANEEKYDLLKAASKEAQLDIYNKLEAERYRGGFQGLSTRNARDISRAFLANNTVLAKQLSDINIENAKIMGDAHVRRARLMGEAGVKASELKGDASVRGEERLKGSNMDQAERTGLAEAEGASNLIKNQDYVTNLRNQIKFAGYQQEQYELERPGFQDDALSSGVITESAMLEPYRVGQANYGNPDVAKQMIPKQFDLLGEVLNKLTNGSDSEKGDAIKSLSGLVGKIGDWFKKDKPPGDEDTDTDTGDTGDTGQDPGDTGQDPEVTGPITGTGPGGPVIGGPMPGDTGTTPGDDSGTGPEDTGVPPDPNDPDIRGVEPLPPGPDIVVETPETETPETKTPETTTPPENPPPPEDPIIDTSQPPEDTGYDPTTDTSGVTNPGTDSGSPSITFKPGNITTTGSGETQTTTTQGGLHETEQEKSATLNNNTNGGTYEDGTVNGNRVRKITDANGNESFFINGLPATGDEVDAVTNGTSSGNVVNGVAPVPTFDYDTNDEQYTNPMYGPNPGLGTSLDPVTGEPLDYEYEPGVYEIDLNDGKGTRNVSFEEFNSFSQANATGQLNPAKVYSFDSDGVDGVLDVQYRMYDTTGDGQYDTVYTSKINPDGSVTDTVLDDTAQATAQMQAFMDGGVAAEISERGNTKSLSPAPDQYGATTRVVWQADPPPGQFVGMDESGNPTGETFATMDEVTARNIMVSEEDAQAYRFATGDYGDFGVNLDADTWQGTGPEPNFDDLLNQSNQGMESVAGLGSGNIDLGSSSATQALAGAGGAGAMSDFANQNANTGGILQEDPYLTDPNTGEIYMTHADAEAAGVLSGGDLSPTVPDFNTNQGVGGSDMSGDLDLSFLNEPD